MQLLAMSSARVSAFKSSAATLHENLGHAAWRLAPFLACAFLIASGCATIPIPAHTGGSSNLARRSDVSANSRLASLGQMPLYFIENRGQVDPRAAYYLRGKDKTIYFTSEGITFVLTRAHRESAPSMLVRA